MRKTIGIAWYVREGGSLKDAIQQAAHCHKEKFGCWPDHIMTDSMTAKNLDVEELVIMINPFIGRSYTFLLYHGGNDG